jgi:hypothetical protein
VRLHTKLPRDDDGTRLVALYDESKAKEAAVTHQLLNPSHKLPHETYMNLVSDLRAIQTECDDNMLAIAAHHKKVSELPRLH